MAGGRQPAWRQENNGYSRNGGPSRRKRASRRGLFISTGAAVVLGLMMAAAAVMASAPFSAGRPEDGTPSTEPTVSPSATPQADEGSGGPEVVAGVTEPSSSTVEGPRTAASSWSAGPTPAPPTPAPPTASGAARLAAEANETYGVRIVLDGQDWGATEAAQEANVGAVISAIDRLPDTVISAVVAHAHGPLAFVSNDQGRTLDGWQPYGGHTMTYYTNSDQGPAGHHASNQVVLGVGSASTSVGHEVLHAYQFRNVGADQYALALLQPEMRSFMAAVGWRQTGSDEEVRQAASQPWSALDALFVYEGRALTYTTAGGVTGAITAANPIEAFAIAGSIYYTRPSWMPLPEWPEYWAWLQANVG